MRVANAPCSWGVLEFEDTERSAPSSQVLDEIASTGYEGTELGDWGFMPTHPPQLIAELARRRLTMLGAFVPVRLADASTHTAGAETAIRKARLLAAAGGTTPFIVLADDSGADATRMARTGRLIRADSLSPEQWTVFARECEAIARSVRDETGEMGRLAVESAVKLIRHESVPAEQPTKLGLITRANVGMQ
jgi:inosose dehydratase